MYNGWNREVSVFETGSLFEGNYAAGSGDGGAGGAIFNGDGGWGSHVRIHVRISVHFSFVARQTDILHINP